MTVSAQGYFAEAQWIGAITRKDAKIPEGRLCSGSVIKQTKAEWEKANPLSRRSIILRRSFKPYKTVKHAELRICGLGFYEATINGEKVGSSEFAPTWSDYDKTVFFNVYDVTQQIKQGDNELRVLLGNGFYNEQGGRYVKLKVSFGPPTLLYFLYLTYDDGMREHVYSDNKWQWAESPITFNSIYGGEDYDARLEERGEIATPHSDHGSENQEIWKPVVIMEGPAGRLHPQIAHSVKLMERYPVKQVLRKDSILVLDMGQNLAGYPEITVQGKAGQWLKLTPGETLDKNGLVDQRQTGRPHFYTYILRGERREERGERNVEVWHPRFSYYGYRYLQVEGDIDVLVATSIVENGLDIPNANTMIINNAHQFGLSDLHQMRGRVGRSDRKAFCYLLIPSYLSLTDDAQRRLRAIEEFSSIGSGFNIAMRDLDIRGAGNILGAEQSGFISEVGYDMYHKILNEALEELRMEAYQPDAPDDGRLPLPAMPNAPFVTECLLETDLEALLPDDYVTSVSERLLLYRELGDIDDDEQLAAYRARLADRFGPVPEAADELIRSVRLRRQGKLFGIEKLILKQGHMVLHFPANQQSPFYQSPRFMQVIRYVQQHSRTARLRETADRLTLSIDRVASVTDALAVLDELSSATTDA